MTSPRIPTAIAVALWGGSALAVLGYTLKSYKETVNGDGGASIDPTPNQKLGQKLLNSPPLVPLQALRPPPLPAPQPGQRQMPGATQGLADVTADVVTNVAGHLHGGPRPVVKHRVFAHPSRPNNR